MSSALISQDFSSLLAQSQIKETKNSSPRALGRQKKVLSQFPASFLAIEIILDRVSLSLPMNLFLFLQY